MSGAPLIIHLDGMPAPKLTGGHVHTCPECYEHVPCEMTCSCERDMDLDDGTPRGSYVTCDARRREQDQGGGEQP